MSFHTSPRSGRGRSGRGNRRTRPRAERRTGLLGDWVSEGGTCQLQRLDSVRVQYLVGALRKRMFSGQYLICCGVNTRPAASLKWAVDKPAGRNAMPHTARHHPHITSFCANRRHQNSSSVCGVGIGIDDGVWARARRLIQSHYISSYGYGICANSSGTERSQSPPSPFQRANQCLAMMPASSGERPPTSPT